LVLIVNEDTAPDLECENDYRKNVFLFLIHFEVSYLLCVRGRKEISSEGSSIRETAVTSKRKEEDKM